jgi:hypothetical protein
MEGSETFYLQNHSQVGTVGGAQLNGQTQLWDTISNLKTQPITITSPGDPLAAVQASTTGAIVSAKPVSYDMNNRPVNNTIAPGVYCGGLGVGNTNGVSFTLSPGVYVMAGGGLTLNALAKITGTGVTIYNTSSAGCPPNSLRLMARAYSTSRRRKRPCSLRSSRVSTLTRPPVPFLATPPASRI